MEPCDIGIALGNALDNAIEAAEKCEEGKGKITCIFRNINDMFIFNAYSARTAHPFQRNGAPFRFKLSKAQQVD